MIEPGYVRKMAQYNAWQNRQLSVMLEPVPEADLRADRGAFFGSIFGTLNHLLWADTLWMSRFTDAVQPAQVGPEGQLDFTPTFPVWTAERFTLDGAIRLWADKMHAVDLAGTLTWSSGLTGRAETRPLVHCITHFFNHQTHHRGQVHAMMTALGLEAPITDLIFMPEDA